MGVLTLDDDKLFKDDIHMYVCMNVCMCLDQETQIHSRVKVCP